MCGIVGFSGCPSGSALRVAVDRLSHRGPDDRGMFLDPDAGVGLGHTRLAIVDLSPLGHQPMADDTGQVVIAFNGEIYNHADLRRRLESLGICFRGRSDTEVLLRLYMADGADMLASLNGIFAFAIWDGRTRKMLIARDALGVKPLYLAETRSTVAFASEIKSLLEIVPDARELDLEAIRRYVTFLWNPGPGTPLKRVRKVSPGEALWVQDGRIIDRFQWYRLPAARGIQPDLTPAESVSKVSTGLQTAVHRQMMADVPVGAFLSGGLDSSAVVAFAREYSSRLECFTIDVGGGNESGTTDDLPYARTVAAHLGVRLHTIPIDSASMASNLEAMVYQLDEPLADPAALNVYYISRLAKGHGITVLLSGTGGDDLFSGYRRHRALAVDRYLSALPPVGRAWLEAASRRLDDRVPSLRRLGKLLSGASLDGDVRLAHYFAWTRPEILDRLWSADARAALSPTGCLAPFFEFLRTVPADIPPLERLLALEQRFFLADHNLIYSDKMSMAVGVESRVPFLDTDLVELAARIPPQAKQRGRCGKWVLKEAMKPFLPHDVIHRPKTGFGAPVRRWIQSDLRPLLMDILSSASVVSRGLFDPREIAGLISANDAGRIDGSYTLLSLFCVELWCRAYLDHHTPLPLAAGSPARIAS